MFTGIVREVGEIDAVTAADEGARLRVRTGLAGELGPGDSVAVAGACLTASGTEGDAFEADVMNQTLSLTTLGELVPGDRVNLELALRADERLGGHFVQGHVDGTGTVVESTEDGFARRLRAELDEELLEFVVERGSIAIEGVSLTVAALGEDWVEVALIPETLERTTLGALEPGARVNVECDLMARYLRKWFGAVSPLITGTEG